MCPLLPGIRIHVAFGRVIVSSRSVWGRAHVWCDVGPISIVAPYRDWATVAVTAASLSERDGAEQESKGGKDGDKSFAEAAPQGFTTLDNSRHGPLPDWPVESGRTRGGPTDVFWAAERSNVKRRLASDH